MKPIRIDIDEMEPRDLMARLTDDERIQLAEIAAGAHGDSIQELGTALANLREDIKRRLTEDAERERGEILGEALADEAAWGWR